MGNFDINNFKKTITFNSPSCSVGLSIISMFIGKTEIWKIDKMTKNDLWISLESYANKNESDFRKSATTYEVKLHYITKNR